jgi:DNA-binding LacI/PurR family transcriptional regulator
MPPTPDGSERVGLRVIAKAAEVSLMTVSRALRNDPKISAPTRARVRALAAQLGYRPDPEISRLMGRLRVTRRTRGADVIALVDFRRADNLALHPYDIALRSGVAGRAAALGYGFEEFRLLDFHGRWPHLVRVLRHRGVSGVILLPSNQPPIEIDPSVSWEGFSVVAATTAIRSPRFHQVVPSQLHNMLALLTDLEAHGHRRIAAVLNEALEERTKHNYAMALAWHGHRERILVLPGTGTVTAHAAHVARWLERQRPDAVISEEADAIAALPPASQATIVSLNSRPDRRMLCLDQMPALIGHTAIGLVTGMMHNHETGIPERAQMTLIDGALVAAETSEVAPVSAARKVSRVKAR